MHQPDPSADDNSVCLRTNVMKKCGSHVGRAMRKRRRKKKSSFQSVSLCHQPQYVSLMKFLHQHGFSSNLLVPCHFSDTGRGLQAQKTIKPGRMLISLPLPCLLTTSTVLQSYLGHYIKSWKPRLSPLLSLCVFLVCERHKGEHSDWLPYISVLPDTYTCPAYFPDEVMALLPTSVRKQAVEQREAVLEIHSSNQDFFRSLQPILNRPAGEVLTYEALRWAWCSVNTRSVFMSHPPNPFLSGEDVYALAPFLDLLNHRPDIQVSAGFNHASGCYEIISDVGVQRYQQAFINYGSHDNQRLLLEYGFVASGNPHSVVYVDTGVLCEVLRGDRSLEQKMKFLKENNFIHNLTVSSEGPSWRLMTALRILALPQTLYPQWKSVLLGQLLTEEREQWCIQTAWTLCQHLLLDTHAALDKISHLHKQCSAPIREQLDVVRSIREEERCILGSCLDLLQGMQRQPLSCKPEDTTLTTV